MHRIARMYGKYRAEIRQSRKVHPYLGFPYRSHKEMLALFLNWVAIVVVVVIPYSIWQYSLALHALVAVTFAVIAYLGWFVWTVWGRDRFPLEKDKHQNAAQDTE